MKIDLGNFRTTIVMRVRTNVCYSRVMSSTTGVGMRIETIMENVAASGSPFTKAPLHLRILTRVLFEWLRNED